MKTTFTFPSIVLVSAVGFALLAVIITVGFFVPSQVRQSDTSHTVDNIAAATALPITPNVEFTLKTVDTNGRLGFIGVGGEIDGIINPDLVVHPGDVVHLILVNGDGMPHNLFIPDLDTRTKYVAKIGNQIEIIFEVPDMQPGDYVYYCTVPGHRQLGQEGKLVVSEPLEY